MLYAVAVAPAAGAAVPPPGVDALPPWSDPHAAMQQRGGSSLHHGNGPDITVPIPADGRQRFVIDTVAAYVLRDGPDFEQVRLCRLAALHMHFSCDLEPCVLEISALITSNTASYQTELLA